MSTGHVNNETVAPIHELTLEQQDRIRRASAPTLRDLQAVTRKLQPAQPPDAVTNPTAGEGDLFPGNALLKRKS